MSIPVALADLADKMASFGAVAYLVTTGEGGAPHVVSVAPAWDEQELVVAAGASTTRNAAAQPNVTLLWAAPAGGDYCLIVDGLARTADAGGRLAVEPTRAVLHRMASADTSLPNCVTVLDRR